MKVTTETLVEISNDVVAKIGKVQNAFDQIGAVVTQTSNHWEGSGHDKAVEHYNIRKDDYERIFKALREHVNNLQTIAGVYNVTERSNMSDAEELPGDIIV